MNEHAKKKEDIRGALNHAQKRGHSLKEIADESGIRYGTLRSFASTGMLGKAYTQRLEKWFSENDIPTGAPFRDPESPRMLLARDLQNMVDTLTNPDYSDEFVTLKLTSWIRMSHEGLPHIVKAIEKGGDR